MHVITTTQELAQACARLAQHPYVTVDTEFLRESTYFPILCVAQMASEDEAVVIDTRAEGVDLGPFFDLMANEAVLKVFHAARQDIEIVWHQAALIPHPVFDTHVAAMVLKAKGAVTLQSARGQAKRAAAMSLLYPGDRLNTKGEAEAAVVFFDDGHKEVLKPNAEVTVESQGCKPASAVERQEIPEAQKAAILEGLGQLSRSGRTASVTSARSDPALSLSSSRNRRSLASDP